MDIARSGRVPGDTLVPPLAPLWNRRFPGPVYRILQGDGMIFLAVRLASGSQLYALDAASGQTRWQHPITDQLGMGYGAGLLVIMGGDESQGLDAAMGAVRWTGPALRGAPVVTGGVVYSAGEAVDSATGKVLWDDHDPYGGPVAVDTSSVYQRDEGQDCPPVMRRDRGSGKTTWDTRANSECRDTFPTDPVLAPDRVLGAGLRTTSFLDRQTGAQLAQVPGDTSPVIIDDRALVTDRDVSTGRLTLTARRLSDGAAIWKRTLARGNTDQVAFDNFAAGRWVFSQVGPVVQARRASDGRAVWGDRFPRRALAKDGEFGERISAGPHLLITAGIRSVTAYTSLFTPAARGVQALPDHAQIYYGARTLVEGRAGTALAGGTARLFARGRRLAHAQAGPDGFLSFRTRLDRNSRLRVAVGSARSRSFTVFVYPREHYHTRRLSPTRIRELVSLRGPRQISLAGHRLELYIGRTHRRVFQRLGTGALHRIAPGLVRAAVDFAALRHVGPRDFLAVCVHGQARAGLGAPRDRLLRHCGSSTITF